jgi:hypothetical protein
MPDNGLMTADDPSVSSQTGTPIYGLFQSTVNVLALEPDSFLSYSYSNESKLLQYPVEGGAFQQYNKVGTPFDVRIQVVKGGTVGEVAAFIATAEGLGKSNDLNLYTMITPERTYTPVNVAKVSHDHKASHGANMVTMDIYLLEIRETAAAFYSNTASPTSTGSLSDTKTPSAQDPKQAGTVQPQPATTAQTNSIIDAIARAQAAQNHAQMSH